MERGGARDRRLAEITAREWTASVVEAARKDNEKQNSRWLELGERAWGQLQLILDPIDALAARPIMQVRSVKKALADPKTESDARGITTIAIQR